MSFSYLLGCLCLLHLSSAMPCDGLLWVTKVPASAGDHPAFLWTDDLFSCTQHRKQVWKCPEAAGWTDQAGDREEKHFHILLHRTRNLLELSACFWADTHIHTWSHMCVHTHRYTHTYSYPKGLVFLKVQDAMWTLLEMCDSFHTWGSFWVDDKEWCLVLRECRQNCWILIDPAFSLPPKVEDNSRPEPSEESPAYGGCWTT